MRVQVSHYIEKQWAWKRKREKRKKEIFERRGDEKEKERRGGEQ